MAANVRFRGTFYNTTGPVASNRIEILDTEWSGFITPVMFTKPNESFEGLTQDLKPGIYPTSIKLGMFIRSTPEVITGTTMGVNEDFLTDIQESAEGRFLVACYRDDVRYFVGPIIYDQCAYEDIAEPYLMNITAVDGMARWQTVDYVSQVGEIHYYSRTEYSFVYSTDPNSYDGVITITPSITLVEHTVTSSDPGDGNVLYQKISTWAWRQMYSINSPGDGWQFQGQGLWAKAITGTNPVETEVVDVSYHYTLDIDDSKHRTVLEYFTRGMAETKMDGEYESPNVMFDIAIEWREHDMTTGDPAALTRLHEDPMLGNTWWDALLEVCREFNLRVYSAKGRYHIEQISLRDSATFTRYTYESDGTLVGTETASLDLNFSALTIKPGGGGQYKFLAPFKSVEAKITLDGHDLLEGVSWKDGDNGMRYLGRIKRSDGVQKMNVIIKYAITSTFDPNKLAEYPQSILNIICPHVARVIYSVRLTNITTGTTYYLEPASNGHSTVGTWEISESEITPAGNLMGGVARRFTVTDYGHTVDRKVQILAEDLPGSENDMIDIHVSFRAVADFENGLGFIFWYVTHPNKFWNIANSYDNSLKFYSVADLSDLTNWIEAESNAELVYVCENDVDNSIKVKMELQWADTTQHKKSIEIYNGTDWQPSSRWSILGVGTPVSLPQLLVTEIMSLRTLPRKLYSGSFLSSLPSAENRFLRGTSYYLPLSCNKDSDVDTFQGEFLEIAKTTPPETEVIESPIDGEPLPGPTPIGPPEDFDPGLYFETDEEITASSTLTQVAIINTLDVYVASGETVSIVDLETGNTENVTLTQEILPGDVVMYFESNMFANTYPDGSLIVLQDGGVEIESGGSKYRYDNHLYNGATHTVPVALLSLVAVDGLSNQKLNDKIWVFRNGSKMIGLDFTSIGLVGPGYWWYDSVTNNIEFHPEFEFIDELININIDLNR